MNFDQILNSPDIKTLLELKCEKIPTSLLRLPGSLEEKLDFAKAAGISNQTLVNLTRLYKSGALGGSGYLSVLAVDQGVEHSALFSFLSNPKMFDPQSVLQFAIDSGFSAVAIPFGTLFSVARQFCYKIPIIAKITHNELLTVPPRWIQTHFATVKQIWDAGCIGVGITVYFGSEHSREEIEKAKDVISQARDLGLLVFCWCYPRNKLFRTETVNLEEADDITSQAVYLGCALGVDFVKQKIPSFSRGFRALKSEGYEVKVSKEMLDLDLSHQIEMVRLQVLHANAGRIGLLSSGGESEHDDFLKVAKIAIINKRAGGTGLMIGRKVFKHGYETGFRIAELIHHVYLENKINLA
ncbi:MAG: class I fructose-bisphosphate aldolase [Deltaproteobacteria bacterium]|nr:class I fructose-bisphosphate aldolase [Deltaproteobacteria bacterium]